MPGVSKSPTGSNVGGLSSARKWRFAVREDQFDAWPPFVSTSVLPRFSLPAVALIGSACRDSSSLSLTLEDELDVVCASGDTVLTTIFCLSMSDSSYIGSRKGLG